ncbi:MAG: DUF1295 domain-containing protein [bacterium]|nr:DUF1295 domain-containing protein [bacterium]
MKPATRQAWLALPLILAIGAAIAWAGSAGPPVALGLPLFALCGLGAFVLNWIVFAHAFSAQTERYYDATGSLTYLTLTGVALALGPRDPRALLIGGCVMLWALRLGTFLVRRISEDGGDGRFDAIKPDFARFLMAWTLQGLWVFLTLACGLVAMTTAEPVALGLPAGIGLGMWVIGWSIEVIADQQKRVFRHDDANDGRFITTGLWSWSQHPNYFGEILLWAGIAVVALPTLQGTQLATLISPVFVFVLLTRISGIPLLRARSEKRWGDDPEFVAYRARTSLLVPRPPRA